MSLYSGNISQEVIFFVFSAEKQAKTNKIHGAGETAPWIFGNEGNVFGE